MSSNRKRDVKSKSKSIRKRKTIGTKIKNSANSQLTPILQDSFDQINYEVQKRDINETHKVLVDVIDIDESPAMLDTWLRDPEVFDIRKVDTKSAKDEWLLRQNLQKPKRKEKAKIEEDIITKATKKSFAFTRSGKDVSFKVKDEMDVYISKGRFFTGEIIEFGKDKSTNTYHALVKDDNGQIYKVYKGSMYQANTIADKVEKAIQKGIIL